MNQAVEPQVAPKSRAPSRWGIRAKVFSLVMLAVLLPTVLVGTSAYWTAGDVLTEKLSDRLNTRASLAAASIGEWFQEREHDASVFASSTLVTSNDGELIEAYLAEVRGRFPMYSGLAVLNLEGTPVATAGDIGDVDEVSETLSLDWGHDPPELLIQNPIRGSDGAVSGYLLMTCGFGSLGAELIDDTASEQLILVAPQENEDRVVMAQPSDASLPRVGSYTVDEQTLTERRGILAPHVRSRSQSLASVSSSTWEPNGGPRSPQSTSFETVSSALAPLSPSS